MSFIKIDGVEMPTPSTFSVKYADIDGENTTRTETGALQRDRIRANIRTLTMKWEALTGPDASKLLQAVSPERFDVEFVDPLSNVPEVVTLYAGDRTAEVIKTGHGKRTNVSFDNVEY